MRMKKHTYVTGVLALALTMGTLPIVALAEDGGDGGATVRANEQEQSTDAATSGVQEAEVANEQQKQAAEVSREQQKQLLEQEKDLLEASSSSQVRDEEGDEQEIDLEMEDDSDPATSLEDLKQKIEVRKQQLERETASTTPDHRNIVEDANPVRLAVHSLLASKELLKGIGPQVSEIAKQVNDSVATTTNAEVKIRSRSFFTRLLFGGDSEAANAISREVAKNQQRIDDLNKLFGEANVPADIQTTLKTQLTALEDAQARLQDLARREQKMWGLFSWRLF